MVDVFLVVAVAIFWFEVPLRGSLAAARRDERLYLLSTLGLGLFVSTISDNQQQAMMTATFFFLMPMIYLSGFIFPIENMPAVIQPITYLIPLRYYLVIVRGIFLKGVGLETLWPQALALLAWGVGILVLATLRSQKRVGWRRTVRPVRQARPSAPTDVQCGHRFALSGMAEVQNGHSFVVTGAGASARFSRFICLTTMKMAKATIRKSTTVLRNTP